MIGMKKQLALQTILSLSQAGLQFTKDEYDRERYQGIQEAVQSLLGFESQLAIFQNEAGYPTPKVDVRGAIFKEGKILLVQERLSGEWSLPGGFADIGLSATANIKKEIKEETGFSVEVNRLIGVYDTNKSNPENTLHQYYKLIFLCDLIDGEFLKNVEVSQLAYFSLESLPCLSVKRTSQQQLMACFEHKQQIKEVVLD